MGNKYFKHRSVHKYTRVVKGSRQWKLNSHDRSGTGEEGYAEICAG